MPGGSGTSTDFAPPSTSSCYLPRMTRAQALALRTAGTLDPNCVIVITDGPTIGVVGFATSPTEIELNPTSATEIGMTARVHTTFDNTPWAGHYDIDLGTGTIIRLEDNKGNVVDDPTGVNVQTKFPWSAANFKSNFINGIPILTGWGVPAAAGVSFQNNVMNDDLAITPTATLDMTGVTVATSSIADNKFDYESITTLKTSGTSPMVFQGNDVSLLGVFNVDAGNAGPVFLCNKNTLTGGARVDIIAGSASFDFEENQVVDAFRMNIVPGAGAGQVIINANVFRGANTTVPAVELLVNKTAGTFQIDQCNFDSDSDVTAWTFSGTGNDDIRLTKFICPTTTTPWLCTGAGNITITSSVITNFPATVNSTGGLGISRSLVTSGSFVSSGAGRVVIIDSDLKTTTVTTGAGSARALTINGSSLEGTSVAQNRTAVLTDILLNARLQFAAVTFSGAVAPGISQNYVALQGSGTYNFADPAGNPHITDLVVTGGAFWNSQAGSGPHTNIRVGGGGTLNSGVNLAHNSVTYEITGAQTLTIANTNRLRNVGFTNTV